MNDASTFFETVKAGDRLKVEEMLHRDPALANAKDENGLSAVLTAMYYGKPQVAALLVERGAELDIFEASAAGQLDRIRELLEEQPELANAYAPDGFQPLGLAAFFGHTEIARLLLERGAEVNSASRNAQRVMPLHSAVASQSLDIARLLLERGADVNARQADDFTPLHGAGQNGQIEMVRLLLANGADGNARTRDGQTPLDFALKEGHTEAADLLKQAGGE